MTPDQITVTDIILTAGGFGAGFLAWLGKREIERVGIELANKADKEQAKADKDDLQRQVEGLNMQLKETRDRRDADIERMERASAEKFAEFTASVRDRLGVMERNVDSKLDMISTAMGDKLDTVVQLINQIRKE